MTKIFSLSTDRLVLRQWKESDRRAFARMNADPKVMEYYPATLSKANSDSFFDRISELIEINGWGFWALEHKPDKTLMGFVGLHKPTCELPVGPCIEIGWRLAKEYWGQGFATEAAQESLKFAFEHLKLAEVYSFTSVSNQRSWKLMERLGMINTGMNFNHPIIPEGHPLSEHFLYKIEYINWRNRNQI